LPKPLGADGKPRAVNQIYLGPVEQLIAAKTQVQQWSVWALVSIDRFAALDGNCGEPTGFVFATMWGPHGDNAVGSLPQNKIGFKECAIKKPTWFRGFLVLSLFTH
jgi:hypothetical protein